MSTDDKLAEMRAEYVAFATSRFDDLLAQCESPIEKLFLSELLFWGWGNEVDYQSRRKLFMAMPELLLTTAPRSIMSSDGRHVLMIQPELTHPSLGPVRPDFMVVAIVKDGVGRPLVVELDGHDFHERTKEQARRDRSRDRSFVSIGWRIVRFTGSEIYANSSKCHDELEDALCAAAQ